MKILLTVHQFLPDHWSGTEILTLDTARELRKLGHDVSVMTAHPVEEVSDAERFDEYEYDRFRVMRFLHSIGPMGGQRNTTESEFDNWMVAGYFRKMLRRERFDLVHFFHLMRLSASVVDACRELNLPTVLTPTDFWFICPTCQLRLPDNSFCQGPDPNAVNCLRHIVTLNQPAPVKKKIKRFPDWSLALLVQAAKRGWLARWPQAEQVRALTSRPEFLRERLNMMDRVIAPTHLMEEMLKKNGLRPEKLVFRPYGINMTHLHNVQRRPSSKVRVGFIGTLSEHKGAQVLITAVRSVPELRNLEVRIYGRRDVDPGFVQILQGMAQGEDRIQFCGSFPNQEIGAVLGDLDALVVPSIWYENAPLVVYSSQAARLPIIASRTPGLAEIIQHDVNGLLFEPGNAEELAKILQRICAERDLLPRLASNAPRAKSMEEYACELNDLYKELVPRASSMESSRFPTSRLRTSRARYTDVASSKL